MSGFRQPEVPREQIVLWSQQLEDAIPVDHPVRLFDELLQSKAFAETFAEWEPQYDLREGQPPYHPRDLAAVWSDARPLHERGIVWLKQRVGWPVEVAGQPGRS